MRNRRAMVLAAVLPVALSVTLAVDAATPKVVAFNATVRVDLDANGKPLKVEASADLPDAIRRFVERQVGGWQYESAMVNGVAAATTTFVRVGACAIPTPARDAFRMAIDFKGNGPRAERLSAPAYPPDAARRGIDGSFDVVLDVRPDGSTGLVSITPTALARARDASPFESILRQWARSQRFEPERVAGRPIATKVRVPVDFNASDWTKASRQALADEALGSSECRKAGAGGDDGMRSMAIDSPVKVTPTPTPAG